MKKIAFIRVWSAPPIASAVARMLRSSFPEYAVDVIDVAAALRRRPDLLFLNFLATIKEYGPGILNDRSRLKLSFWRTTFLFRRIRRLLAPILARGSYEFSIQLHSLFDASLPGLPHYVYTDHTHLANLEYPDFDPAQLFSQSWIGLEKTIYANARRVFTRSQNITHSVVNQYGCPPEKVVCVYVGSNLDSVTSDPGDRDYHQQHILFVGIDWERKGGPDLLQAFQRIQPKYPLAHLTIVGCQPPLGDLPNVSSVGEIPVADLPAYYQQASIFCLPTHREPFGVAILEAMAHKLPVIATNIGAIPDFIENGVNGYLIQPGNVDELACRLDELLESQTKRRLFGQQGYQVIQDRYNWDQVGQRIRRNCLSE